MGLMAVSSPAGRQHIRMTVQTENPGGDFQIAMRTYDAKGNLLHFIRAPYTWATNTNYEMENVGISYDGQNWILRNTGAPLTVESGLTGAPFQVATDEQIYKWPYSTKVNFVITR